MSSPKNPFDDVGGLAPLYDPSNQVSEPTSIRVDGPRSREEPPNRRRSSFTTALISVGGLIAIIAAAGLIWSALSTDSAEIDAETAETAAVSETAASETAAPAAAEDSAAEASEAEVDAITEPAVRDFTIEQIARPTITTASALAVDNSDAVALMESVGENGLGGLIYSYTSDDQWKERGAGRRFVSLNSSEDMLVGLVLLDGGVFIARSDDLGNNWASNPVTLPPSASAPALNLIAANDDIVLLGSAQPIRLPLTDFATIGPDAIDQATIIGLNATTAAVIDSGDGAWADQEVSTETRESLGIGSGTTPDSSANIIIVSASGSRVIEAPFPADHALLSLDAADGSFEARTMTPLSPGTHYVWRSADGTGWTTATEPDRWQPPDGTGTDTTTWRVRFRGDRTTALQQQSGSGDWATISLGDLDPNLANPDRWHPTQLRSGNPGFIIIAGSGSADRSIAIVSATGDKWESFEIDSPHAAVTVSEDLFMVFGLSSGTPRPDSTADALSPALPMDLDTIHVITANQ